MTFWRWIVAFNGQSICLFQGEPGLAGRTALIHDIASSSHAGRALENRQGIDPIIMLNTCESYSFGARLNGIRSNLD